MCGYCVQKSQDDFNDILTQCFEFSVNLCSYSFYIEIDLTSFDIVPTELLCISDHYQLS